MSGLKPWIEAQTQSLKRAVNNVHTFLQTPLGSAIGGGLVVVLVAHYGFGIG